MNAIHGSILRKCVCFCSFAEIEGSQQLETQITKLSPRKLVWNEALPKQKLTEWWELGRKKIEGKNCLLQLRF